MPDIIKISELDEALALADAAEFPYYQDNAGQNTTYKAPMTQIGAKIVEGLTYQGINLPAGAGNKTVENSLNYLIDAIGGDPNANITDEYDPTAAYVKGDLCINENALYICTAPTTGDFDPSNWTATTIDNVIGSLSTLTTTDKSSLVGAVNEVDGAVGDLTTLTTTDKSSAVSAINEVNGKLSALYKMATKVTLTANTTKTVTVTQDTSSRVGFIVFGQAAQGNLSPIFYLVGGYVTASRCSVTNISGKTGVTVDASSTANLNFGFANTTGVVIDLYFLPLYDNTFTAS